MLFILNRMVNTFSRKSKLNGSREALHVANQRTREGPGLSAALIRKHSSQAAQHQRDRHRAQVLPLRPPLRATLRGTRGVEQPQNIAACS